MMDRLTMQAAMSGNMEARRRFSGALRMGLMSQSKPTAPVVTRKPGELPVALQSILDTDRLIAEVRLDRRMMAATQKEFAGE